MGARKRLRDPLDRPARPMLAIGLEGSGASAAASSARLF